MNKPKINYQVILEKKIKEIEKLDYIPTLLLHSCCAPCGSYVLEYLANYFKITVYYYNPNITFDDEYQKRYVEQQEFIEVINKTAKNKIEFLGGEYDTKEFYNKIKGLEDVREGGERCFECFDLRLTQTAKMAKELNYDYFTTALSISPLKNGQKINEIGIELEERLGIKFLRADFKKKNGYKRSIELSRDHNLYRQDYCGCVYSKLEREEAEKQRDVASN
ncbi:epoxyqueuosine reductase QueH [Psychrilyobacter atlanticus]|uniref:epoxyqueuosine reductase QueH n=1 Tax=Psychrilyobacter atlanticus TaxID=271091 RepID=UPI0004107D26|nr:epoxyqueuosine reductase QueH [Psychrilyobacter atlanticus]